MRRLSSKKIRGLWVLCLIGLVASLPSGSPRARGDVPSKPDRSDAGSWYGTWYHKSRDFNMAIWIREDGGVPDIQLRFFSLARPEGFLTSWSGQAEYTVRGGSGSFSMVLGERDANTIEGRLDWRLDLQTQGRAEHGDFVIYRTGDGRTFSMDFAKKDKIRWRGDNVQKVTIPEVLTFRKASKRHVLWEELPI